MSDKITKWTVAINVMQICICNLLLCSKKIIRGFIMQKAKIFAILLLVVMAFTSCISGTNVTFHADQEGAEVFVDGELIGTTPVTMKISNGIWEDPDVLIKKDGFKDLRTGVTKELKGGNLAIGLLLNWPALLWVYGPKANQHYILTPEN